MNKAQKPDKYNIIKNYFFPYRKKVLFTIIALFFTSGFILSLGKAVEYLVNQGFNDKNIDLLNKSFFYIFIIILGIAISSYIRFLTINSVCEKVITNIRKDIYTRLINQEITYYENNKVSDIITYLINDCNIIIEILSTNIPFAVRYIITIIGGLFFLFLINIKLTLYVFLITPITIIPLILIAKYVKKYSSKSIDSTAHISSHLDITLNNIKTVQLYQREEYEIEKFFSYLNKNLINSIKRIKFKSLLISIVIFLIFNSICFILWIGVNEVISGRITAGNLSSFIYYSIIVASGVAGIGEISTNFIRLKASLNNIEKLLSLPYIEKNNQIETTEQINHIVFKDLSFAYPSRQDGNILNNINLTIEKREKIAILGPSGAGKTTIFQLLLKIYNYKDGDIKINDESLYNIDKDYIRQQFTLVTQDPIIFPGSIYENIKYGNIDATDEEIRNSAEKAGIFDFFSSLPNGLHTSINIQGMNLSGGEKQRISIARAFLKNSNILLLDEPTSNLDKANEEQIQKSFLELMKDKTSIIITHNPSLLNWVDKIIVINNHQIEAIGRYDELLKISMYFKKFVNKNDNLNFNPLFFN